jgi:hypothetical protein
LPIRQRIAVRVSAEPEDRAADDLGVMSPSISKRTSFV